MTDSDNLSPDQALAELRVMSQRMHLMSDHRSRAWADSIDAILVRVTPAPVMDREAAVAVVSDLLHETYPHEPDDVEPTAVHECDLTAGEILDAILALGHPQVAGEALVYTGENRDEVREFFRKYDVPCYDGENIGTDYGFRRDPETGLPVGEPALRPGDTLIAGLPVVVIPTTPSPQTVTTVAEFKQLPAGTAVRDRYGSLGEVQPPNEMGHNGIEHSVRFTNGRYKSILNDNSGGLIEVFPLTVLAPAPAVTAAQVEAEPFAIDAAHLDRQREFSDRTFGPGSRLKGVLAHIGKELVEVEARPDDASEWADLIILAFDGATRNGHTSQAILDAVLAKQVKNEGRTWPDWREFPEDQAIEHVEDEQDAALFEQAHPDLEAAVDAGMDLSIRTKEEKS